MNAILMVYAYATGNIVDTVTATSCPSGENLRYGNCWWCPPKRELSSCKSDHPLSAATAISRREGRLF